MELENMNVVTCPPCGESTLKGGKGVVKGNSLLDNPPSALRATSKVEKLFDNPPTRLRRTSPARGAEEEALRAKHPTGGEVNGGFTLIELLVVVLIIGILAAVALPQYQMAARKSRLSKLMQMCSAVVTAQKAYHLANGNYTDDWKNLDISFPGTIQPKTTITSPEGWKIILQIPSPGTGAANRVMAYDDLLPGVELSFLYNSSHSQRCYADANNNSANQLCHTATGNKGGSTSGGSKYVYYFN